MASLKMIPGLAVLGALQLLSSSPALALGLTVTPNQAGAGGGSGSFEEDLDAGGGVITFNEHFNHVITDAGGPWYLDKTITGLKANKLYSLVVNVRNDSGATWEDFHFHLANNTAGIPNLQGVSSTKFANHNHLANFFGPGIVPTGNVNFFNGSVPDDGAPDFDDATFNLSFIPSADGDITLSQYATVPAPVPVAGLLIFGTLRKLKQSSHRLHANKA